MADPNEFARRIQLLSARITDGTNRLVRKAALAADSAVVLATPVDTGRARSNWIVSLGSPVGLTIPAYKAGKDGNSGGANAQAAIDQGAAEIGRYVNGEIHITNNLPYIERLNEGWSAQAPAGFVQKAIQAAVAALDGVRVLE